MYSIRKLGGLSLIAMALVMPCAALAVGDTKVASKAYVDTTTVAKDQGVGNAGMVLKINAQGVVVPGEAIEPGALDAYVEKNQGTHKNELVVTNNSGIVTTSPVTDMLSGTYVEKSQGVANKVLVTDEYGNVTTGTVNTDISASQTSNNVDNAYIVNGVTASGNTVTVNKGTVKIPVSSGAPSMNTPSGYSEIWIE